METMDLMGGSLFGLCINNCSCYLSIMNESSIVYATRNRSLHKPIQPAPGSG
jgi:hypothetical protein